MRAEAVAYMCTLLIWKNRRPGHPIVIAANRDEFEGRAATPPRQLIKQPLIAGGRDEVAGGTWLAISAYGIVVALTNRRGVGKHDPSKSSRGRLVLELAQRSSLEEIRETLERTDPHSLNPFVLVALDACSGFYAQTDPDGFTFGDITAGVHAVTNWEFDSTNRPKGRRALELAEGFDVASGGDDELAARLHVLLSDHARGEHDMDGGLCVHRPAERYGTRSSAIVLLGQRPAATGRDYIFGTRYFAVEGHPCANPLFDVTALLKREDAARAGVET